MTGWDGKVARVDQPEPGLLSLSLRLDGRTETLLIATLPGALEMGLVPERPRGASATPAVTQLRRHLEGARVQSVERSRRAIRLSIRRASSAHLLVLTPSRPYGAWWLCELGGPIVIRSPGAPAELPVEEERYLSPVDVETLRDVGASVLETHGRARAAQLERALSREVKRLRRKKKAISADLDRASQAEELHEKATLLLAHAAEIGKDATVFEVESWSRPGEIVRVALDPTQSATELAQELFAKSKRLKRGLELAPARLEAVNEELQVLERLQSSLVDAPHEHVASELQAHGISIVEPRERERKRRRSGGRLPYRTFVAGDATKVLVGRGAADNDRLTLRVARPQDLWLHARGVKGAHVVVPLSRGQFCSSETLVDAATLAVHFSDMRGESVVDVLYTPRRFVRKRKGSPIGSVTLEREKVIAVRIEPERLERLLQNETRSGDG